MLPPNELTAVRLATRGVYPLLLWQTYYALILGRPVTALEVHQAQTWINYYKTTTPGPGQVHP